jgi:UDP-N-acetylglucosamine pyrophosphorylase
MLEYLVVFWNIPEYSRKFRNNNNNEPSSIIDKVGVVVLAGGKGKRMKSSVPKQFLPGNYDILM